MPDHKDLILNEDAERPMTPEELALERIKQMTRVVCICKGIPLGKVLEGMPGCETVADVNQKVGSGTGGCKGERCGPRIKILLKKYKGHKTGGS
jgi:NAD(P)H-nitrite reductase large subunit